MGRMVSSEIFFLKLLKIDSLFTIQLLKNIMTWYSDNQ